VTSDLEITATLATGGHGPEDVKFDAAGRPVAGLADGTVVAIDPATGARELLGDTGSGQVLGVFACADGSVLACNHDRGLYRLRDGQATALLTEVEGRPLTFPSNVTQASDGTIYFTTSSARWHVEHFKGDMLEHSCTGRLIRLATDGTVTVLLRDLAFANGVVLAADESHLVFAQTGAYSLTRYWLTGPRAGTTETMVESLPGFPDNMSVGSDGLIWVAMASPRNGLLDALLPRPGLIRTIVWNLPEAVQPKPDVVAWAMAYAFDGTLVHDLRLHDADYTFVTGVAEREGLLVLSSLHLDDLAVAQLPLSTQ
jgi:sugar lactone lactonase YvrE